jgi:hypothetical protein
MSYERAVGCGTGPRLAAYQSPRKGVEFIHARRHPWNAPPSYAVGSRALTAAAHQMTSSSRSAASITPAVPVTTCVTGSQGILHRRSPSAARWPTCWWAVTMSPPNGNGPGAITPQGRPDVQLAATATPGTSLPSVRRGGRKRRYPVASASHYRPVNGRGRDWLSIRCPRCGGVHLARLRPGTQPGGPRRTPCGKVFVVVRRTYAPKADVTSGAVA